MHGACSNAYRTMRSTPARVKTVVSTRLARARTRPAPEYSPSMFSRTKSMSTSSGPRPASGHGTPGSSCTGRTFAHRSSPGAARSKSPQSVTSSGTAGSPTAPSRIASNPRATATPSLGIIAPCSCQYADPHGSVDELELDGRRLEHLRRLRHHLRADAVAGDHADLHGTSTDRMTRPARRSSSASFASSSGRSRAVRWSVGDASLRGRDR